MSSPVTHSAAPEPESLDAAFLEYLANLEGDDDDWTLLADAADAAGAPARPADHEPSSDDAEAPQSNKEAARPAAEQR